MANFHHDHKCLLSIDLTYKLKHKPLQVSLSLMYGLSSYADGPI